jgi:DNA-binding NarL/FixJ family response regulator
MPLRIFIADDHEVMREGTRAVIKRREGWEVCGVAGNGREAVAQAIELEPDIVILDMMMPELNGLDAAVQIKRRLPKTEILIFTGNTSDQLIRDAFGAGVKSVIHKTQAQDYLVAAIDSLSEHKPFFSDSVSEVLFSAMLDRPEKSGVTESGERLTAREREIMQLLAEGKSNKEVAAALNVSVRTAETHRASILRKLNLDSVASLVRYAIRNNLIEP